VRYPATASEAANRTDRRNRDKLGRSPGSYFVGRARELVLAAPYLKRNLKGNAYGGTATAHYQNLCAASYAMVLSAFEVSWKALFAGVIDAIDLFDDTVAGHKRFRDAITPESVLAHREEGSPGGVIASSLGTWQRSEVINSNFEAAFGVRPVDGASAPLVDQFWQLRHIVAHGAGVVAALDSYRLGGSVESGTSLLIDSDYLKYAEEELVRIVTAGVRRVSDTVLRRYLEERATGRWDTDAPVFTRLYLLGLVVPKTQDLPGVTELDFNAKRAELMEGVSL